MIFSILKRFQNTTTVKMHEIVFNTIISKNVLLSTVKKASSRQAEKSIALLQMSKPLQKEWAEELLVIIKKSNFSIMRKLWSQTKYRKGELQKHLLLPKNIKFSSTTAGIEINKLWCIEFQTADWNRKCDAPGTRISYKCTKNGMQRIRCFWSHLEDYCTSLK